MSELKDLISIIVPVYKVEKYLERCVESLRNQTYKNLEIVLVDDGSPDNCPQMCDNYALMDDRIKVVHKLNGGLSDARNVGVENSTGEYIMFVDSDDFVDEHICEILLKEIKNKNLDMSMCGAQTFEENPQAITDYNYGAECFSKEQTIEQIYYSKIKYVMTAWAKLYRREVVLNLKYPLKRFHEDEFVFHKLFCEINGFCYVDLPMYFYFQRTDSIMGSKSIKKAEDRFLAFSSRFDYLQKYYPQNNEKNINLYLAELRGLYATYIGLDKNYSKKIKNIYNKNYKLIKKHTKKDLLFKYLNWLYILLQKLKNKTK